MAVIQTLRCLDLAARQHIVHGTMPFPSGVNTALMTLVDQNGVRRPTQAQVIGQTVDFDIVELSAHVDITSSGDFTFDIVDENPPSLADLGLPGFSCNTTALAYGGGITLTINDSTNSPNMHDLGVVQPNDELHRQGALRQTIRRFKHWDAEGLGAMVYWLTIEAGRDEIILDIDYNNCVTLGSPHVTFRNIELTLPAGWAWTPMIPEDAIYDQPNDRLIYDNGNMHGLFCQFSIPLRVVIYNTATVSTPNITREGFGVGDWSGGGYGAQQYPIHDSLKEEFTVGAQVLAAEETALAIGNNATSTPPGPSPLRFGAASTPPDIVYPTYFTNYGGAAAGSLLWEATGIQIAATAKREGLKYYWIVSRRWQGQQYGHFMDEEDAGHAIDPRKDKYGGLNPSWDYYNFFFLGNLGSYKQAPFTWLTELDKAAVPPVPYENSLLGALSGSPLRRSRPFSNAGGWDPVDPQHQGRYLMSLKPLIWLDWDPLAWHYMSATSISALMTYWPYGGTAAGRMEVPVTPNRGGLDGRDLHWITEARLDHYVFGSDAERSEIRVWLERLDDMNQQAIMPNGGNTWSNGKVSTDPPFSSNYIGTRFNECIYAMWSYWGVYNCIKDDAARKTGIENTNIPMTRAIWDYVWQYNETGGVQDPNDPTTGCWDKHPVGTADGGSPPNLINVFTSYTEWGATLTADMNALLNPLNDVVGAAVYWMLWVGENLTGAGDTARGQAMLAAYLGNWPVDANTYDDAADELSSFNPLGPGSISSAHISQWGPLLSWLKVRGYGS